jgi:acyl-CoA thioester hydrolase
VSGTHVAFELPEPFVQEREVVASEIDRLGHVNNAAYLQWCEAAGWAHTEKLGCDFADWQRLGRAMVVHRASLHYAGACHEGDALSVAVWLVANDERLRATRRFQIVRHGDGRTVFRGEFVYACVDLDSGRPRRMPDAFKRAYAVLPAVAAALARERER